MNALCLPDHKEDTMRISCVKHPPNQRLIVIHQWQLDFCDGNTTQAALLSFFEYWHNIKLDLMTKAQEQGKKVGESDLLQHHNDEELSKGILRLAKSHHTILAAVKKLKEKGVISLHKNPNKKMSFDKTKHYRFYPEILNRWLDDYKKRILSIQKPHGCTSGKNAESNRQKCQIEPAKMPEQVQRLQQRLETEKNTHGENENFHKKSVCVLDKLNDSEQAAWKWSQKHDFWKGRITTVRQLRTNFAEGKPFRVQFEQAHPTVKPVNGKNGKKVKVNGKRMKAKDCPYCNERGVIYWNSERRGRMDFLECPHDPEEIRELAIKKEAVIDTAKPGYEDPAGLKKPKITPAEKAGK